MFYNEDTGCCFHVHHFLEALQHIAYREVGPDMATGFGGPAWSHNGVPNLQLRISPLPSQVPPQTNHLQENAPLHVFEHTLKVLVDFGRRLKTKNPAAHGKELLSCPAQEHKRGALVDGCRVVL